MDFAPKNLMSTLNRGKKIQAVELVKKDPETVSIISKLIKNRFAPHNNFNDRVRSGGVDLNLVHRIVERMKRRITDSENLLEIFPDMEMAIQILVSSILSPKDMTETTLIYRNEHIELPSDILSTLMEVTKEHIDTNYKIEEEMSSMLTEMAFISGAYIKSVMPESMVDGIINGTLKVGTESYTEAFNSLTKDGEVVNLGFLGPSGKKKSAVSLESLINPNQVSTTIVKHPQFELDNTSVALEHIEISDNYNLLKLPKLLDTIRSTRRQTIAFESSSVSGHLHNMLYKNADSQTISTMIIPSSHNSPRKSVSRPLVDKIPTEAVIPIHVPGDPSKHIGYLIMIDEEGYPVTLDSSSKYMCSLDSLDAFNNATNTNLSSNLLNKVRQNLSSSSREPTLNDITTLHDEILLKDLEERFENGLIGKGYQITDISQYSRIMLARSLSSRLTRIVYIPIEFVTYFSFKHHNNGVGKSLLDSLRHLMSMRAILLFSKVMAITKASINNTNVNIKLDPDDPDVDSTIEMVEHYVMANKSHTLPLGINSAVDLVDWVSKMGTTYSYEGHPDLPDFSVEYSNDSLNHTIPDDQLEDILRKQTYMAIGIPSEIVDSGFDPEFARSVVNNNIMFAKRVGQFQDKFTTQLSDHIRKILRFDVTFVEKLLDVINDNEGAITKNLTEEDEELFIESPGQFKINLINEFIKTLEVDLPRPDVTTLENQLEAFNKYKESLESTVDYWISSDILNRDLVGEFADNIDSLREIVISIYLRKWCAENNFMPELNDLVSKNEDGDPYLSLYDISLRHTESIMASGLGFLKELTPLRKAADKDLEKMNLDPSDSFDSDGDETDTDTDTDEDDMGDLDLDDIPTDIEETPDDGGEDPIEE